MILFTSINGLVRVAESGGAVTPVTTLDASRGEVFHDYPQFLPDGKHFLYYVSCTKPENNGIFVGSLDSKERKLVLSANSNPRLRLSRLFAIQPPRDADGATF